MNLVTVKEKSDLGITFDNGYVLSSDHDQECCEQHYLDFSDITLSDFENCIFDLDTDFFENIEDYGIALIPTNNYKIRIPGYGYNNGYYSSELILSLYDSNLKLIKSWDISECQVFPD